MEDPPWYLTRIKTQRPRTSYRKIQSKIHLNKPQWNHPSPLLASNLTLAMVLSSSITYSKRPNYHPLIVLTFKTDVKSEVIRPSTFYDRNCCRKNASSFSSYFDYTVHILIDSLWQVDLLICAVTVPMAVYRSLAIPVEVTDLTRRF